MTREKSRTWSVSSYKWIFFYYTWWNITTFIQFIREHFWFHKCVSNRWPFNQHLKFQMVGDPALSSLSLHFQIFLLLSFLKIQFLNQKLLKKNKKTFELWVGAVVSLPFQMYWNSEGTWFFFFFLKWAESCQLNWNLECKKKKKNKSTLAFCNKFARWDTMKINVGDLPGCFMF